jgi:predicted MFS family arabinose efflux permease
MIGLNESVTFWFAFCVQSVGIAAMIVARMIGKNADRTWCERTYYLAFSTVGAMMLLSAMYASDYWFSYAVTISVMIIGVILDFDYGAISRKPTN